MRRILGPIELRQQVNDLGSDIMKLWDYVEEMEKSHNNAQRAAVSDIRNLATEIIKVQEKIDAFISVHEQEPEEDTSH